MQRQKFLFINLIKRPDHPEDLSGVRILGLDSSRPTRIGNAVRVAGSPNILLIGNGKVYTNSGRRPDRV